MRNNQRIKSGTLLPEEFTNQLVNTKETGMGYHKVDLYLRNGDIIKNQIVLNSSFLLLEFIKVEDIEKIIIEE